MEIETEATYPIPYHHSWDIIDSSKLSDFSTCLRKGFFLHLLGWKSDVPNNHLVFGEAIHEAMEHLLLNGYTPESCLTAYDKFHERYRKDFSPETDSLFGAKIPARVMDMLIEYVGRYPEDQNGFDVVYTEISGSTPVSPTRITYFRMDSLLKYKSGLYGSLEHKTRGGSFSESWKVQWPMSFQIGQYHHVLYCLYPEKEVNGITLNGLGFLKTKFDFQRFPYRHTKNQMRVWMATVNYWMDQIENELSLLSSETDSQDVMRSFPCNPAGCDKYFGCPFNDFCSSWANPLQNCGEPPMGFKVEFWDPTERPSKHQMDLKMKED